MSSDFGPGRRSARTRYGMIMLAIFALVALAVVGTFLLKERSRHIAEAGDWTLTGAACPMLDAESYAALAPRRPKRHEYDGIVFARAAGHVDCNEVVANGGKGFGIVPVCQFTSPATLSIVTRKGAFYFNTGVGRPATVSVEHGDPKCVLAAKFTLAGDSN